LVLYPVVVCNSRHLAGDEVSDRLVDVTGRVPVISALRRQRRVNELVDGAPVFLMQVVTKRVVPVFVGRYFSGPVYLSIWHENVVVAHVPRERGHEVDDGTGA